VIVRPSVTAIVLAGGRSSRFGRNKLEVRIDGASILERAIRAARTVADEVIVAGSAVPDGVDADGNGAPTRSVPDDAAFAGPLAGLAGALRETTTALAIVVGGDMPDLAPAVLESMLRRLAADRDLDAVLLQDPGPEPPRRQVLPLAVRAASVSDVAADAVRAGDRSLVRLVDRLRIVEVPVVTWLALDPEGRTLRDVDRPADLHQIHDEFR
jgi:molybdenum cofactor guanylyltransferase